MKKAIAKIKLEAYEEGEAMLVFEGNGVELGNLLINAMLSDPRIEMVVMAACATVATVGEKDKKPKVIAKSEKTFKSREEFEEFMKNKNN